jgi:hypothetical protein
MAGPLSTTSASQPGSARNSVGPSSTAAAGGGAGGKNRKDKKQNNQPPFDRKAFFEAQFPLKQGRPVAFKHSAREVQEEGGITEFAQGKVTKFIGTDKNKCVAAYEPINYGAEKRADLLTLSNCFAFASLSVSKYEIQDIDDAEGPDVKPGGYAESLFA